MLLICCKIQLILLFIYFRKGFQVSIIHLSAWLFKKRFSADVFLIAMMTLNGALQYLYIIFFPNIGFFYQPSTETTFSNIYAWADFVFSTFLDVFINNQSLHRQWKCFSHKGVTSVFICWHCFKPNDVLHCFYLLNILRVTFVCWVWLKKRQKLVETKFSTYLFQCQIYQHLADG